MLREARLDLEVVARTQHAVYGEAAADAKAFRARVERARREDRPHAQALDLHVGRRRGLVHGDRDGDRVGVGADGRPGKGSGLGGEAVKGRAERGDEGEHRQGKRERQCDTRRVSGTYPTRYKLERRTR